MNHGKDICRQLKQLRRDIADQNGIELEIPECTYEGDCSGTCPRCDYELRYLESELARRQRLGKAAIVAGTVLTMASFQTANAQEPVVMGKPAVIERDVEKKGVLKGIVTEKRTGEPLLSCNVVVKQNGEIIGGARTDWDGLYTIKGLAKGVYDVEFSYIGYKKVVLRNYNVKAEGFTICNCELVRDSSLGNKKEVVVKTYTIRGIIDTDKSQPDSTSNRTPVIVIDGDDLHQVITYMYILAAKHGGFIVPRQHNHEENTSQPKTLKGFGGRMNIYGITVDSPAENYWDYCAKMSQNEMIFVSQLRKDIMPKGCEVSLKELITSWIEDGKSLIDFDRNRAVYLLNSSIAIANLIDDKIVDFDETEKYVKTMLHREE